MSCTLTTSVKLNERKRMSTLHSTPHRTTLGRRTFHTGPPHSNNINTKAVNLATVKSISPAAPNAVRACRSKGARLLPRGRCRNTPEPRRGTRARRRRGRVGWGLGLCSMG
jgi:hypothetical protein